MPRVILREEDFIIKGKLPTQELNLLARDVSKYTDKSFPGGLVPNLKGGKLAIEKSMPTTSFNDNKRNCLTYFPQPKDYPTTVNILHSLLIENYLSIYDLLDYSSISSIQYVKYNKGHFFKKHNDVVTNIKDSFRVLTMSINMTDECEYNGGDLLVYNSTDKVIGSLDKSKGSFIILPAFFTHEAAEVTLGTREAIVTWLSGTKDSVTAFRDTVYNGL